MKLVTITITVLALLGFGCATSERIIKNADRWGGDIISVEQRASAMEDTLADLFEAGKITKEELDRGTNLTGEAKAASHSADRSLELMVVGSGGESAVQDRVKAGEKQIEAAEALVEIWGKR